MQLLLLCCRQWSIWHLLVIHAGWQLAVHYSSRSSWWNVDGPATGCWPNEVASAAGWLNCNTRCAVHGSWCQCMPASCYDFDLWHCSKVQQQFCRDLSATLLYCVVLYRQFIIFRCSSWHSWDLLMKFWQAWVYLRNRRWGRCLYVLQMLCFFVFFLIFFLFATKYETTVLGNGWTDFHETFTKR